MKAVWFLGCWLFTTLVWELGSGLFSFCFLNCLEGRCPFSICSELTLLHIDNQLLFHGIMLLFLFWHMMVRCIDWAILHLNLYWIVLILIFAWCFLEGLPVQCWAFSEFGWISCVLCFWLTIGSTYLYVLKPFFFQLGKFGYHKGTYVCSHGNWCFPGVRRGGKRLGQSFYPSWTCFSIYFTPIDWHQDSIQQAVLCPEQ